MNLLGISLAVGRLTLDQLGQVRILDPQPAKVLRLSQFWCSIGIHKSMIRNIPSHPM